MAEKLINIPIYILKNLRPHYLVGWLIRPEKITRKPMSEEEKIFRSLMKAKKLLEEIEDEGLIPVDPKKPRLRLVAVDGKIIDPDFQ